jgi:hypothetical protein
MSVAERLADAPRPGAVPRLSAEQVCQIVALACELPSRSARPISHWSHCELADEIVRRGITDRISPCHAARLLKSADLQPHRVRYWLTPAGDADREATIADACAVYRTAPERAEAGQRIVSTDELTHVQALERLAPDLPFRPGNVARREFEYKRHGTCSFFINFDVASGQVFSPSSGPTRTEADFIEHVRRTVESDPTATQWHFVVDNLDIHRSEASCATLLTETASSRTLGSSTSAACCGPERRVQRSWRSTAFDRVPLHANPRIVDEPGGDRAEHPGWQAAAARQLPLRAGPVRPGARLRRLLQSDDGQAVQVDLSRQATPSLILISGQFGAGR